MKILFVCTGNSYRSPIAEALLKKVRGDLEVESAGTHPAGMIASNSKKILEKENAMEEFRSLIGHTDPAKAEDGTIRKKYATSVQSNAVHGSDSDENALIESDFFFSKKDRY